jgi:DNA-binding PadR family transcriptional regulator
MNKKLLLLGLLHQQGMQGYQLFEFIDRDLAACSDLKKPTTYYLLNQMAQDGWIREEVIRDGNWPERHVFHLMPAGEKEFIRLLRRNLASNYPLFFVGDIGLAYMDVLPAQEAEALLAQRRAALTAALAELRCSSAQVGGGKWALAHQIHFLQSELEWLDQVVCLKFEKKAPNTIILENPN